MEGAAFSDAPWLPGWVPLLAVCAALSMIFGNLVAIRQTNVKRLLAYSGIAHSGYILVGILAANDLAWSAVTFYLLVYGLTNLGAFGAVAAISRVTGGDDFEHFSGVSRRTPVVALLMAVFVLSLAGIPPLSGFVSKFYLFTAAMAKENGTQPYGLGWLVALGIAMSAVSLYYYLLILKQMYIIKPTSIARATTPRPMLTALVVLAVLVVILGVYPGPVIGWLQSWTAQQDASVLASVIP
jgi:NADH-quinone oxidoreductase subunit N